MLLRELYEQDGKTAVIAFGRLNPPTIGHAKLVDKIKNIPGDHYLFLSQTQKPKTDPLDFATKLKFAKQFFPDINVGHQAVKTPVQALEFLQGQGYTDVIFVAGSDRVEGFQKLFDTYNGQPDKTGKVPFKFNSIRVVSAGERDPDADDVSGMSASKMRVLAAQGELNSFAQGVPDKRLAKSMYDAVRAGMGVKESLSEDQEITPDLLKRLEQYVDKLFATLGMDVEFTRHFLDRVNDPRNVKQITIQELALLFKKTYSKWGKKIARLGPDAQAVIKDMSTDINMPFVLNWDPRNRELDLVAKTIMRKKNFTTPNQEFPVENFADGKKEGNVISPPGNTVGLNVFELSPEERNQLNGTIVYHQTKKLDKILQSGGLRPRADVSGEREFALFDLRAGKDWRTPKGIFVSTKSGNWFGNEISFKIEPKDKIYKAYSDQGHLIITNPVSADRFISTGPIEENFADGKKPGRKGLAKRSGVNTKASVSSLRKTAKNSSGEKQRMAHWLANMKAGRAKKAESASDPLLGAADPVLAIYDLNGRYIERLKLSVAARKYKFDAEFARDQFAAQDKVKLDNVILSAPISGQSTNEEFEEEIYYSKKLAPVAKKLFQQMYPEAKVSTKEDGDGYLGIKTTDGEFRFHLGVSHQYGDNIISVGNAYSGSYKGIVGKLVQASVELLKKNHPDAEIFLNTQHDVSDNYWPQLANKLGITYDNTPW